MGATGKSRRAAAGFTLLELVVVVVLLGILARYAMMKLVTPATMTLPTQAQSLADLIRRAQSLAVVRGQRMSVSVSVVIPPPPAAPTPTGVAVACAASAPCSSTNTSFSVSQGVVLGNASTIYFNSLGQPVNSVGVPLASDTPFTLSYQTGGNNAVYTVTVAALTGRVSVSP